MAQVDIAGLLTGIPSLQDPMTQGRINAANLPAGTSAIERELARQRPSNEARMRQSVGGLFSAISGTPVDLRTQGTRAREAIGQLDPNSPKYQAQLLTQLAKVDPMRAAGVRQQLNIQKAKQDKETQQKTTLTNYFEQKYPDQPELLDLIRSGVSFNDIQNIVKQEGTNRYKVSGNIVFDTVTGKYVKPPKGAGKDGYTVSKFYDSILGENVIQFLDKNDPKIVLRQVTDSKDVAGQSATLLKLQANNLKLANAARMEAQEANAVALKLEKAAKDGMTGGIVATGEEFIKSILGSEDETTILRKSADRLRVSRGVANLPVGPASDKDVALVMGGELSATANPETVASYVRGIVKLAKAEEDFYNAQNSWLDRYKGDIGGFSSYLQKEQLEKQLGHSSVVAAIEILENVNYDPAALEIFKGKFGFDYMEAKERLDRATNTLTSLKREDF